MIIWTLSNALCMNDDNGYTLMNMNMKMNLISERLKSHHLHSSLCFDQQSFMHWREQQWTRRHLYCIDRVGGNDGDGGDDDDGIDDDDGGVVKEVGT